MEGLQARAIRTLAEGSNLLGYKNAHQDLTHTPSSTSLVLPLALEEEGIIILPVLSVCCLFANAPRTEQFDLHTKAHK